jgi:hypothetical protein
MQTQTNQQIHAKIEAVKREMVALQTKQTYLALLEQLQSHGIAHPNLVWFDPEYSKFLVNR